MVPILRRFAAVVWIGALALVLLGLRAIWTLPSGIYPEMKFPRIMVVAHSGQLAADLVEAQITRPLETELATIPGVRHIRAKTIRGAAELGVQLTDDTDPVQAQAQLQSAIDHITLPAGTETVVERVLPTSVPVITFNLGGVGKAVVDPRRLREVAELIVRPAFVRVGGVGAVEVQGGRTREVIVQIKPTELAALHLTPDALAKQLAATDVLMAAGRVFDQRQTLPVVLDSQVADLAALRDLPIRTGSSGTVSLSAVADVLDGAADPDVIVRAANGEVVTLAIARMPGESTVAVVDGIVAAAQELKRSQALPSDVELTPVYDQAALVTESLAGVRDAILLGVLLTLIVIAVSLRDWRAGLIAAVPVPITLLGTFAIMQWCHVTLNLMSLGGLAVAIGLVVDDTIVVSEGIVARIERGHLVDEAIVLGVRDMMAAVIGTTFTTVVVFVPLAMLTGVTGSFLGAFAITLVIAVILSLVTSLTVIPLLSNRLRQRRNAAVRQAAPIERLTRRLVHYRLISVLVVGGLVGAGYVAYRTLSTGFLPAMDEGAFVIDFTLPAGTSLEETDRINHTVDDILAKLPAVTAFTRRTGTELGPATATLQNEGDIMVALAPVTERGPIDEVIAKVRDALHGAVPEARFAYIQVLQDVLADLSGNPEPIELQVLGADPRSLDAWAAEVGDALSKRPELVDVFDGREGSTPILRATVQPRQLVALGLDAATVGGDLEVAIAGREVAQLQRPERVIAVRVRYPDAVRTSAPALARSTIAYGPTALPLGQIVTFDRPLSPAILRRDGLRPALLLHAATPSGDLGAAETAVREVLADHPPPRGAQIEIGGQAAAGAASRRELLHVALVAVLLVLIVLVFQLHSLRVALVVLITAPLSTVGGLVILALTGMPLDLSSLTGLILLVGLVVKNGILLLEYAQRVVAEGQPLDVALGVAVHRRVRPILMTTAATIAGLAPLAIGIGSGSALQRPLAIAVLGGLALATAVTLFITPALAATLGGFVPPAGGTAS